MIRNESFLQLKSTFINDSCNKWRAPNKFINSPSTWSLNTKRCKSKWSTYTNLRFQLSSQIERSICMQFELRWKESRSHCRDYWSWSTLSWSYCRCHFWLNLGAAPFSVETPRKDWWSYISGADSGVILQRLNFLSEGLKCRFVLAVLLLESKRCARMTSECPSEYFALFS